MTDISTQNDAALARHNGNGQAPGLMERFATEHGLSIEQMYTTLRDTIFPTGKNTSPPTNEQIHALLIVADQHGLSPWKKEIYAFPSKGGGVVPIVGVDGWYKLMNSHPQFDGMETVPHDNDKGGPLSVTCTIHRKDRGHPISVTEYLKECYRDTPPWNQTPRRMLRHRAICQCIRVAFSLAGIYEPDEGARFADEVPADLREVEAKSETLTRMQAKIDAVDADPLAATNETRKVVHDDAFAQAKAEAEDAEHAEKSPVELFEDARDGEPQGYSEKDGEPF